MWGIRIYKFVKTVNQSEEDSISFADFIKALRCLCRSEDQELDMYIFQIFDLGQTSKITQDEITMMLINFPDMGFSNQQNINIPDRFYTHIKDAVIKYTQEGKKRKS